MGRYYTGDIEGKFWFGVQSSYAPENIGGELMRVTFQFADKRVVDFLSAKRIIRSFESFHNIGVFSVLLVISLYAVDLSLAVASIASVASAFVAFIGGEPLVGFASIGSFLVCGALSVLMFFGCGYVVKGVVFVTRKMLLGIKSWFIGKEN